MQELPDIDRLGRATVRILTSDGAVVGAGFPLRSTLIATCAHVVSAALGIPNAVTAPEESVLVDFPGAAEPIGARVRHWSPIGPDGRGDIAVLELPGPAPDSVAPLPFWPAAQLWGGQFRMFGFPAEVPDGVWVSGEFRAAQSQGWVQLQAATGGQPITGGFSGAPVWDTAAHAVAGMAVAADGRRYTRTAFMLPIDEVLRLDPALLSPPYRGMEPFDEEHAPFFYGRDGDIERILDALRDRSFAAVVGRSGIGKSSLVRAGVLPRVREQGRRISAFRLSGDASGARAVTSGAAADDPVATWLADRAAGTGDTGAAELLNRVPAQGTLLFVDQFEELAAAAPDRARALLRALIELTRADAEGRLWIVCTLRWDAFDELLDTDLAAFLGGATVALAPLGRAQLRDVITRPAARLGVTLDDAVVERLVDEVADQPGGLPLLASVLPDLWVRRTSGRITLTDYENVGSVAVSIARRAEQVMAQFTDPVELVAAQRALGLLAIPTASGAGFVRTVLRMRDHPELREVVGRLAIDRLVVIGRDQDGADTVELAHQALIDNWARLHDLLQADRDFRTWQQQLTQSLDNWERRGREHDALLRGTALDTAEDQLAARKTDVPQPHRDFITASRRRRGREVRRLRIVAATLTVLVVVATSMAVVAYRSGQARAQQLRWQAGRDLAAESLRIADSDPERALQFAQAAARHAPDDHEVRTALLNQQVRMAAATSQVSGLWSNPSSMAMSGDGETVAVTENDHDVTVWTGFTGAERHCRRLPPSPAKVVSLHLSGNGAALAVVTEFGAVTAWRIGGHTGPVVVREPEDAPLTANAIAANWDPNGALLALRLDREHLRQAPSQLGHTDAFEVYDLAGQRPVRVAAPPPPDAIEQYPQFVAADGATIAMHEITGATGRNVLRDARTGQRVRELPQGVITASGLIVGCADGSLIVSDATTGAERFRTEGAYRPEVSEKCHWDVDASQRYAVRSAAGDDDVLRLVYLVDLGTGKIYTTQVRNTPKGTGVFLGVPGPGAPQLTQLTRSGFLRFAPAVPMSGLRVFTAGVTSNFVWSPHGRYLVALSQAGGDPNQGIRIFETSPAVAEVARVVLPAPAVLGVTEPPGQITADERHFVLPDGMGGVTSYALPDLTVEQHISLPYPPELGARPHGPTSVLQTADDELAFYYAGTVTRRHIGDWRQVGATVRTWSDLEELRWSVEQGVTANSVPTHPDRFLLATRDADVVRNVADGRVVRTMPLDVDERYSRSTDIVRPGTPVLYKIDPSGGVVERNLDTGAESRFPHRVSTGKMLRGLSADGVLVLDDLGKLEIWDIDRGAKLFELPGYGNRYPVIGEDTLFYLTGDTDGETFSGIFRVDLDRDGILQRLCGISDRDYTPAERDALPVGADTARPCRGVR
ncbi:serine protease [Nocardia spumae]|uniref:serine protease n=1 Tax=Nocardia spumae TaxID=2887190 RepID=UPI001D13FEE4|nr:serine protease [Nocardia spumae]